MIKYYLVIILGNLSTGCLWRGNSIEFHKIRPDVLISPEYRDISLKFQQVRKGEF